MTDKGQITIKFECKKSSDNSGVEFQITGLNTETEGTEVVKQDDLPITAMHLLRLAMSIIANDLGRIGDKNVPLNK